MWLRRVLVANRREFAQAARGLGLEAMDIALLRAVTAHPDFLANELNTRWRETNFLSNYGQRAE